MNLNELQKNVDAWIKKYGVRYFNELTNMAMINIDLRVEKGFQAISENLTIGDTSFAADQRLEQIMLSVGMKF